MILIRLPIVVPHVLGSILLLLTACSSPKYPESEVSGDMEMRTGHALGAQRQPGEFTMPPGLSLNQSITDEQAVQIALWNNAEFQTLLGQLGVAKARFVQSTEIVNPTFMALIPMGPKQLEFAARFSLEALWTRDQKIELANTEARRNAEQTVLGGLDLVRDVKLACGDLRLALATVESRRALANTRGRMAELASSRLASGDISELEAASSTYEAADAFQQLQQAEAAVRVRQVNLLSLLGAGNTSSEVTLAPSGRPAPTRRDLKTLLNDALATRPEVRLAELAMEAAGIQAKLTEKEIYQVTGIIDANGSGSDFEIGPGLEFPIPIFNQNEGAKSLAAANLEQAARQYISVRDLVIREVRQSYALWEAAAQSVQVWERDLIPQLESNFRLAETAVNSGDLAPGEALLAEQRIAEAQLDYQIGLVETYRAKILLERALGHRLDLTPPVQQTVSSSIP